MIGPVSGTGRAMMASLQQAMQKGMPPDQAIQYVKSMATQGVAPLADLYSMMNQFQRLKQQQVKPPQTPPTIRDQLNMMDQQQQQMTPPMNQGLGGIDAGSMENPSFAGGGIVAFQEGGGADSLWGGIKDFGSAYLTAVKNPFGGIAPSETSQALSQSPEFSDEDILIELRTALLKGDQARADELRGAYLQRNSKNLIAAQRNIRQLNEQIKAEKTAQSVTSLMRPKTETAPPAPAPSAPSVATQPAGDFNIGRNILNTQRGELETEAKLSPLERARQSEQDLAALGIGEASRKRGEYLTQREAEAGQDLAKDKRMALAQAGFAMAEAASRRGRERTGFLGAAAIGGTTGTKLYQAALKENRAIKDKIAENRFALEQANEMIKMGNYRDGVTQANQAKQNLRALDQVRAQNEAGIAELMTRERGADRRLGAQLAAEKEYRQGLLNLRQQEANTKKISEIALIPDKKEREQALLALLGGISGGEDIDDLVAKYK